MLLRRLLVNTYSTKPMPMGVKFRKLHRKEFYLSPADTERALELVHGGSIRKDRELVEFIDQHGGWLD